MVGEYKLVDALVSVPVAPSKAKDGSALDPNLARWFHQPERITRGFTMEDLLTEMDTAGVEKAVLVGGVVTGKRLRHRSPYAVGHTIPDEDVEKACRKLAQLVTEYPGRFCPLLGLDPTSVMRAVRQLERGVKDYGIRGCHIMPSFVGLPPNHACYFPVYAKCVELGVPIVLNIGLPGPMAPAAVQHPLALDEVLLAFRELVVVGCHVGHPWHHEVVALLQKHANFYLITSAWAPQYVPAEIWQFANTRGRDKILWASDYPLLTMQRCATEGWELPLKEETKRGYLRDNALRIFQFEQ